METYQEFMDEIKSLIHQEIKQFLKNEGFYRCVPAKVTQTNNDKCSLDTVSTNLSNILNKSGEELVEGDSVVVMEKYGSNYSNCFVLAKNQNKRTSATIESLERDLTALAERVAKLESVKE